MIEGLSELLNETGLQGLTELREVLADLLSPSNGRLSSVEKINKGVYRLKFVINKQIHSLVVKKTKSILAIRNWYVTKQWLPNVGILDFTPEILAAATNKSGKTVWSIFNDLGTETLAQRIREAHLNAAVEAIAKLHSRFTKHPLIGEIRMIGDDLGANYYSTSLHDASIGLKSLESLNTKSRVEYEDLLNRLINKVELLQKQEPDNLELMKRFGGEETLLHGDLWTKNIFVSVNRNGANVKLIDWDHVGVGIVSFDLSTFLQRIPKDYRSLVLDTYRLAYLTGGHTLPKDGNLNKLFQIAEYSRILNCLIWPPLEILYGDAHWGWDELSTINDWFDNMEPILPEES